jgi:hypothetical protein
MALYRFLFAPVLLAVAVLLGSQHRTASTPPAPAAPASVEAGAAARGAEAAPGPATRSAALRPAPVH